MNAQRIFRRMLLALAVICSISFFLPLEAEAASRWSKLGKKYRSNDKVNQLVFVQYQGGSRARLRMYTKTEQGKWKRIITCLAYVGRAGIDKEREGDGKTPCGDFPLTGAFGIKPKPTTAMKYTRINKYLYLCGDKEYYNQLIDIRKHPHKCSGEHLSAYRGYYDYGMFIGFNRKNIWGRGSAIFLHCSNGSTRTSGCVSVSKKNMLRILAAAEPGARICIYPQ